MEFWSAISLILSSAGSIYIIFNPADPWAGDKDFVGKKMRRDHRKRILQSLIHPPAGYMKQLKRLRNMQAHADEYLDDALEISKQSGRALLDYQICAGSAINDIEAVVMRR